MDAPVYTDASVYTDAPVYTDATVYTDVSVYTVDDHGWEEALRNIGTLALEMNKKFQGLAESCAFLNPPAGCMEHSSLIAIRPVTG